MTTWSTFRRNHDDSGVTEWVEGIIYQQKFEGAAADMLNADIVSRELGLADKKEVGYSSNLSINQRLDEIDGKNTGLPPVEDFPNLDL